MKVILVRPSVSDSLSPHSKMTPDRRARAGRRAMIPRGLLGDGIVDGERAERAIDCRSPTTTATFLEADNDTLFGPKLVFSRGAEG